MAAPASASPGQHHGDLAARQFPLVPRPRTACRPLAERIERVARLSGQAGRGASDALLHAAEAFNLAALIASDCAMPGLARLHIRDGDGDAGYQLLESLYAGTRASRTQAAVDGRAVNLASLIAPGGPCTAIVQWLWTVLLSDGLRALCRAGHWTAALHQAQRHNGIGQRLLDGRQIAVLAASATGQRDEAEQILQQTTAAEPWEHAVAACLRAINLTSDNLASAPGTPAQMTRAYLAIDDPGHAMFTARLGLTVAELSDGHGGQQAVIDKVKRIAIQAADAYIAREVLTSPAAAFITRETRTTLRGTVHRAGLGNPLTTPQQQQLMNSISSAATTLAAALIPVRT